MQKETFLAELEPLDYYKRVQYVVRIGQTTNPGAENTALLAELQTGNIYERRLALQACSGSRDKGYVVSCISDPSATIRQLAIALVPVVCEDSEVVAALETLTRHERIMLLERLHRRNRQKPIDIFLDNLASRDERQLLALVGFGSPDIVRQHQDQLYERGGSVEWHRFARLQPVLAAQLLQQQAETVTELDRRLLYLANIVLPVLGEQSVRTEYTVLLVRSLRRYIAFGQLALDRLARRYPNEIADLFLETAELSSIDWMPLLSRLTTDQVKALVKRGALEMFHAYDWLKRLRPAQRVEIYLAFEEGFRSNDGTMHPGVLELLPGNLREAEARRHLSMTAVAAFPDHHLSFAAYLPWNEGRAILNEPLRDASAEVRSVALSVLISAVRFQRDHLSELLSDLRERRHEQDPVRNTIFGGLLRLPQAVWQSDHLNDLAQLIEDALNASDLSRGTGEAIERLLLRLLPFHPQWSVKWFARLMQHRGFIGTRDVAAQIPWRSRTELIAGVLPVLISWQTRERETSLVTAVESLLHRHYSTELFDLLVNLLSTTSDNGLVARILTIFERNYFSRLDRLIPELLQQDPTWITLQLIYQWLHEHRQDLLTPFLGQAVYKGRFSVGNVPFVLPLCRGFFRWTAHQQSVFAETLGAQAADNERDMPAILLAIHQLAELQYIAPTKLIALSSDEREAVRTAALQALGRLDAGQGVPTLLEALNDDRIRVAIYALRRAILQMPAVQARNILSAVPMNKETVAKEVVRLLGDLRTEDSYQDLLKLDKADLHRDVRIALISAMWNYLDRPEPWVILQSAAESSEAAVAAVVANTPDNYLSKTEREKLLSLMAILLGHHAEKVRLAAIMRCTNLPVMDSQRVLLTPLLQRISVGNPNESAWAASAVFDMYVVRDPQLAGTIVRQVRANRRILTVMIDAFKEAYIKNREQFQPSALEILQGLADDPLAVSLRTELAIVVLPWSSLASYLIQLSERRELHAVCLATILEALPIAAGSTRHYVGFWNFNRWQRSMGARADGAAIEQLEAALTTQSDDMLRCVALSALTALSQPPRGWTQERWARMQNFRADASPLVAETAQFTFTPWD